MKIEGVLLGRFGMADGRPADIEEHAREMVANFRPGVVPVLSHHRGLEIGKVDELTAEGRDLRFRATIGDYPDLAEAFVSGSVPVSLERVDGVPRLEGQTYVSLRETRPSFRGTLGLGANLVGVALLLRGEKPAATGSVAWRDASATMNTTTRERRVIVNAGHIER